MLKPLLLLLVTTVLAGCQAPSLVSASGGMAPQRRVLAAADKTIWGISADNARLTETETTIKYINRWGGSEYVYVDEAKWSGNFARTGGGSFEQLSEVRYVYRVPDDVALVINSIYGRGTVVLNGLPVRVQSFGGTTERTINYVFGPGTEVKIELKPTAVKMQGDATFRFTDYDPISISGYTTDPAGVTGVGTGTGK